MMLPLTPPNYPGHDVKRYAEKLDRCIYRYGLPWGADYRWTSNLDYRVLDWLGYMQPSAPLYWRRYLYEALTQGGILDREDIYPTTILDRRWHYGEYLWDFEPGKIEYQVRRALKGLNYLVMIEFEIFGNLHHSDQWSEDGKEWHKDRVVVTYDRGRLIAPHIQGLLWGQRPSRRQRAEFIGGISKSHGIVLKQLTDLPGAVRYMIKPPYEGRLLHNRPDGKLGRYPWPGMPLKLHHLLFSHLFDFSYPNLTFAGGEGRAILHCANRLWRDYVPCGIHRFAFPQQPFHEISMRRVPRSD